MTAGGDGGGPAGQLFVGHLVAPNPALDRVEQRRRFQLAAAAAVPVTRYRFRGHTLLLIPFPANGRSNGRRVRGARTALAPLGHPFEVPVGRLLLDRRRRRLRRLHRHVYEAVRRALLEPLAPVVLRAAAVFVGQVTRGRSGRLAAEMMFQPLGRLHLRDTSTVLSFPYSSEG